MEDVLDRPEFDDEIERLAYDVQDSRLIEVEQVVRDLEVANVKASDLVETNQAEKSVSEMKPFSR